MVAALEVTRFWRDYLKPILWRVGWVLFLWSLLTQFLDQNFARLIEGQLASDRGPGGPLWIFGGLSMVLSILSPLVSVMLIFYAIRTPTSESLFTYFRSFFSWLLREQIRATGKILLWGILFVLPGIWKFLEYIMLSFIVCLDPAYMKGQVDALDASSQIFRRHWKTIVGLTLGWILLSLLATSMDEYRSFVEHPALALALVVIDMSIFLFFQWALLRVWETETLKPPLPQPEEA